MATKPEKLWTIPVSVVTTPQTATRRGSHLLGFIFLRTQFEAAAYSACGTRVDKITRTDFNYDVPGCNQPVTRVPQ